MYIYSYGQTFLRTGDGVRQYLDDVGAAEYWLLLVEAHCLHSNSFVSFFQTT